MQTYILACLTLHAVSPSWAEEETSQEDSPKPYMPYMFYPFSNPASDISFGLKNQSALVDLLIKKGYLKQQSVKDILLQVDLKKYEGRYLEPGPMVPARSVRLYTFVMELLREQVQNGSRVLQIHVCSGYFAACLGHMVGSAGLLVGVDSTREKIRRARRRIKKYNPSVLKSAKFRAVEDPEAGFPRFQPYDAVFVGAYKKRNSKFAEKLLGQVKRGGRLIIPTSNAEGHYTVSVHDKDMKGEVAVNKHKLY